MSDAPSKVYIINEVILATIPGYAPWPARILDMTGQTVIIEFFGTGHINPVRPNLISPFDMKKIIPLLSRKGYKKAILELEMTLGIPSNLSLVN